MNLRSLALMVFIFAASAALAGYVGMKYEVPASQPPMVPTLQSLQSRVQPAIPPAPLAQPAQKPEASPALAPTPAAVETKKPQEIQPPARNAMQTGGANAAEAPKTTGAKEAEAAKCNKQACENAYRSFDPNDCTWQPANNGPRRLCRR